MGPILRKRVYRNATRCNVHLTHAHKSVVNVLNAVFPPLSSEFRSSKTLPIQTRGTFWNEQFKLPAESWLGSLLHVRLHRQRVPFRFGLLDIPSLMRSQERATGRGPWQEVRSQSGNASRRRVEMCIRRASTGLNQNEVKPTNSTDALRSISTDSYCVLGRRSRTGRLRGPPSHSVLKEWTCPNQPHPSRSPHSHSGLLG